MPGWTPGQGSEVVARGATLSRSSASGAEPKLLVVRRYPNEDNAFDVGAENSPASSSMSFRLSAGCAVARPGCPPSSERESVLPHHSRHAGVLPSLAPLQRKVLSQKDREVDQFAGKPHEPIVSRVLALKRKRAPLVTEEDVSHRRLAPSDGTRPSRPLFAVHSGRTERLEHLQASRSLALLARLFSRDERLSAYDRLAARSDEARLHSLSVITATRPLTRSAVRLTQRTPEDTDDAQSGDNRALKYLGLVARSIAYPDLAACALIR